MQEKQRLNILCVEDSPIDVTLIRGLLERSQVLSVSLECVSLLGAALDLINQRDFDAVLLDLTLPDSVGLETCERLHAHAPYLPIVVLTAGDDVSQALLAVRRGAQDYLVKGAIDSNTLIRSLRYAIERMRFLEQVRRHHEHMRLVTKQLPATLWTTDTQLRVTSMSGNRLPDQVLTHQEMTGLLLTDFEKFDHPLGRTIEAHEAALEGGSSSFELPIEHKSYHVHVESLHNEDQQVMGTIGIALDVSDQRRLQVSMDAARQIQRALFPNAHPDLPGFDMAGNVFPADETAGDYFDYIINSPREIDVVLGDVSGHGLGAALLVVELRTYLRVQAAAQTKVGRLLTMANRFLCKDLKDNEFITLFYLRFHPENRSFSYAAAGHCGFLLRANGEDIRLTSTGLPLGLNEHAAIGTGETYQLDEGDVLLVLTDGFQESFNDRRDLLGIDRILQWVRESGDLSAQEIVRTIYHNTLQYTQGGPQRDDMSIMVLKALPVAEEQAVDAETPGEIDVEAEQVAPPPEVQSKAISSDE